MVLFLLIIVGLCLGSFVNAFVWRLHEGKNWLSDRSECIYCHYKLKPIELIPIISWFFLRGKCRNCHRKISIQYPIVEAITCTSFILSYIFWPTAITDLQTVIFILWLMILTGLISLAVYDLKWMLLPTKIIYFLVALALLMAVLRIILTHDYLDITFNYLISTLIGGGLFYLLYQISRGKWIGGGDIRLGFLLGLIAGTASKSLLVIFMAAVLGTIASLPLLMMGKYNKKSLVPFGPFLIMAMFIVQFFGNDIINWYANLIVGLR